MIFDRIYRISGLTGFETDDSRPLWDDFFEGAGCGGGEGALAYGAGESGDC